MGFSAIQVRALRRNVAAAHVHTRAAHGREFPYIEGWYAIAEANRIFGFDNWDRETVDVRSVFTREIRGTYHAVYVAKVRLTVRADGTAIVREGHGTGEGKGASPAEAHDLALKAAETDATKRALVTFGRPFGLALYAAPIFATRSAPSTVVSEVGSVQNGPSQAEARPPRQAEQKVQRSEPDHDDELREPTLAHPIRRRNKDHLRFVAQQGCMICGRQPSDAHHLRHMQVRGMALKVSDEFTVPLCRIHHRELHRHGNEATFWATLGVAPEPVAQELWNRSGRGLRV